MPKEVIDPNFKPHDPKTTKDMIADEITRLTGKEVSKDDFLKDELILMYEDSYSEELEAPAPQLDSDQAEDLEEVPDGMVAVVLSEESTSGAVSYQGVRVEKGSHYSRLQRNYPLVTEEVFDYLKENYDVIKAPLGDQVPDEEKDVEADK